MPSRSTTSVAGAATAREAKRAKKMVDCILKDLLWSTVILIVPEACDGDEEREDLAWRWTRGPLFMLRKVGSASRVSHERLFCLVETSLSPPRLTHVGRFFFFVAARKTIFRSFGYWRETSLPPLTVFRPVICDTRTKNHPVGEKTLNKPHRRSEPAWILLGRDT